MQICGKSLFHNWFHTVYIERQRAPANFFLQFNLSHKLQLLKVQHNFCSVMCHIVLIWTVILLTLENNIVTLLFNWPKPVHYVPTDNINSSIQQPIFNVKSRPALSHQWSASSSSLSSWLSTSHQLQHQLGWRLGVVVSVVGHINEDNQHRARLVHDGWPGIRVNHL